MPALGRYNHLEVVKQNEIGVFLEALELGTVLLPKRYVPDECHVGDMLEVFLYLDSEDRIIATTLKPLAQVGEFACLQVVSVDYNGAFLDWGLPKDLLVPYAEQYKSMEEGQSYVVYLYIDEESVRITGSSRIDRFISADSSGFEEGQVVDILVTDKTDMGFKAIINNQCYGLLYDDEIFQKIRRGFTKKGYIKKIREDGKIDLILQKPGHGKVDDFSQLILDRLKNNEGYLSVSDKSSPEIISNMFGVSKGVYKKAVGGLYKKRLITIEKDGIYLVDK